MPPPDLNTLFLVLYPFIVFDYLLLCVHVFIKNRIEKQSISMAVMQTILKLLEKYWNISSFGLEGSLYGSSCHI